MTAPPRGACSSSASRSARRRVRRSTSRWSSTAGRATTRSWAATATTCWPAVQGRDTFRLTPFGAADGADVVSGGDGIDEADYSLASPRVVVTLDDVPGDGVDGENDDVRSDVEDVFGTGGDDVLVGDADANQLSGGAGSDDLTGGGGFDALYGGDGVDLLRARDGNPERVDCGADNDFAVVDAFDRVSGCDSLDVSAALQADLDHDGFAAPADCDDSDPAVRPGVADAPDNGLDENCDGADATIADRDRDGVRAPADCDDANAAIRPGAAEVFGNTVDENCDGGADPLQTIDSTVQSAFQASRRSTRVRRLRVAQVRAGTTIRVQCPGSRTRRACRRATHDRDGGARHEAPRSAQAPRPDHAPPARESRIVLWLQRSDSLSRRVTVTFRSRRTPAISERCAPPGVTTTESLPDHRAGLTRARVGVADGEVARVRPPATRPGGRRCRRTLILVPASGS